MALLPYFQTQIQELSLMQTKWASLLNPLLSALGSSTTPSDITGSVIMYAGSTAPKGWLLCDGSIVNRSVYSDLFGIIGTTYGVGNGSTTFNLPNTQGVFVRGAGTQIVSAITYTGTRGTTQGDQFQSHIHQSSTVFFSQFPGGVLPNSGGPVSYANVTTGVPLTDGVNGTPRIGAETRPANIALNYIIKT